MNAEAQTVRVLADRLSEAREALEKLAKKARRYGCPDITITVGESFPAEYHTQEWTGEKVLVNLPMVELIVTGEAPRVGNHEFLARIELGGEAGNLVDTRPGIKDLDARFQTTNGYCAHCNTTRRRNEVYVVRDLDTGEQVQVGRDCLRDFLGIDNPTSVAHRFSFWASVVDMEERGSYGRPGFCQSLEGVVALSAVCVRLFGWCSKSQAQYDERLTPPATTSTRSCPRASVRRRKNWPSRPGSSPPWSSPTARRPAPSSPGSATN